MSMQVVPGAGGEVSDQLILCALGVQVRGGLTDKVEADHAVKLHFTDVGKLPPPVLQFASVTFGYSRDHVLYRDVSSPTQM